MSSLANLNDVNSLYDFAFYKSFFQSINQLKALAETEYWGDPKPSKTEGGRPTENPILVSYINNTFKKLCSEYKLAKNDEERNRIFCQIDDKLVFRTGLFTSTYLPIYAVFFRASKPSDKSPFTFFRYADEADGILIEMSPLPQQANYFQNSSELFFDSSLEFRYNSKHILEDNIHRFPEEIRSSGMIIPLLTGAIDMAKKKVITNYRLAVPTYFENCISLLFPLHLTSVDKADLALAVVKLNGVYVGKTVLTLEMAYNDARLIVKPSDDWLLPSK